MSARVLISVLMLSFLNSLNLTAGEGGHSGNGGGLIARNGEILTFRTAGAKVTLPLRELGDEELPEVRTLEEKLRKMTLTKDLFFSLVSASLPTTQRKYYRADITRLPEDQRQAILVAYQKAIERKPEDRVVLAAITVGTETFLFDDFFRLRSEREKLAILAHESYWVINPKATYPQIVDAEMKFETCLGRIAAEKDSKTTYCEEWIAALSTITLQTDLPLRTAAYDDLLNGRFKGFLNSHGGLPLSYLIPTELMKTRVEDDALKPSRERDQIIYEYWSQLHETYPSSKYFTMILRRYPNFFLMGTYEFAAYAGLSGEYRSHTLSEIGVGQSWFKPWEPRQFLSVQLPSPRGRQHGAYVRFSGWNVTTARYADRRYMVIDF